MTTKSRGITNLACHSNDSLVEAVYVLQTFNSRKYILVVDIIPNIESHAIYMINI
jgi:hypothetical protein